MEYITVRQAAEKWQISPRLAQRYCTEGRIPGAVRFGGTWAIPEDAQKPTDPRKKAAAPVHTADSLPAADPGDTAVQSAAPPHTPMPLLNTPFVPGHCLEEVTRIADPDQRSIALAEYYYFSGQSEKASALVAPYLTADDIALRLSACWIYAYANLALDRIAQARQALGHVQSALAAVNRDTPAEYRALAVFVGTAAKVLLHLPLPDSEYPLKQQIHLLPPGLRMFGLYVQAHHAYLMREYGASIGVVETALALRAEDYPIPAIYLHMVATMDYMSLKKPEQAKEHLLAAWRLAKPDDLIEPLGEHHGLLGGMLEAVIKKDWPDDFRRIIAITYSFSAGWRKIHNPDTGHDVADNLTTTEFAAAMLAARDWSNKEIALHMGISENTVKQYISTALQKLNISQRKELKQYMLS